ncbi:g-type lysozyme inhibitor [Aeromonas caviae]
MKKAVTAALLAMMMAASVQAAAKVTTVPVHFAKGAHSAKVDGTFSGYDSINYTLVAKAGQTMTVDITGSHNANFNILAPGEPGQTTTLGSGYVGAQWQGTLPKSGKYLIQVYQMRATARKGAKVPHSLSVGIQ